MGVKEKINHGLLIRGFNSLAGVERNPKRENFPILLIPPHARSQAVRKVF